VEAKPLGHPSDVAVDGDRGDSKGGSEDDRCRLATDAMEAGEALHIGGDLSTEVLEEPAGHRTKRFRLLVEEACRFDVPLEGACRRRRVVGWAAVLGKEDSGDLVDALVLGLRGQDRRDEELEWRREEQGRSPVGVGLGEAGQDPSGS
jgi:hypothetical protein